MDTPEQTHTYTSASTSIPTLTLCALWPNKHSAINLVAWLATELHWAGAFSVLFLISIASFFLGLGIWKCESEVAKLRLQAFSYTHFLGAGWTLKLNHLVTCIILHAILSIYWNGPRTWLLLLHPFLEFLCPCQYNHSVLSGFVLLDANCGLGVLRVWVTSFSPLYRDVQ